MARIRTVKPELWTDPDFVDCSLSARLLFIASLNFATDHGVLPDKPRQLKMQCLPADPGDAEELIEELVSHHFFVRRTAPNGDKVLVIRTFAKNQKINRPTAGSWGDPAKWGSPLNDSVSTHGDVTEGRDNSEGDNSDNSEVRPSSRDNSHSEPVEDGPTDDRFAEVLEHTVDRLAAAHPARIPGRTDRHRQAIANDIRTRHGPLIAQRLEQLPHSDAATVAASLEREIS